MERMTKNPSRRPAADGASKNTPIATLAVRSGVARTRPAAISPLVNRARALHQTGRARLRTTPSVNQRREQVRSWIARTLVTLLISIVLVAVLGLVIGRLSVGNLKELFDSLGLLTTLVGTAMGYYFGHVAK